MGFQKENKVYDAVMDFEKMYDIIDWMVMWDVLTMYSVDWSLLNKVKTLCKDTKACIKVNGEMSEGFEWIRSVKQVCWFFFFRQTLMRTEREE